MKDQRWRYNRKIQSLSGGGGFRRNRPHFKSLSVMLLNKLTGNTKLQRTSWLDWAGFYGPCVYMWAYVGVCVMHYRHTYCAQWVVWPISRPWLGRISGKEDQWASQPTSYGGLKTLHDLRRARPHFNQLYSVSTQNFFLAFCSALPLLSTSALRAPVP